MKKEFRILEISGFVWLRIWRGFPKGVENILPFLRTLTQMALLTIMYITIWKSLELVELMLSLFRLALRLPI